MNVEMKKYGATLTDRADGKKVAEEIIQKYKYPISLDFKDVVALGSSFGEEVILRLAKEQECIKISHVNNVIKNSLLRMTEETSVKLIFE